MYEAKYVYPALKAILQSRLRFQGGINLLIDTCREHCPDPVWDKISRYDYGGEVDRFTRWYSNKVAPQLPPGEIEVLWVAPDDLPISFTLRGSSDWSRDPEDWRWFYNDDYDGPRYESKLVSDAYWLTDYEGLPPERESAAESPQQVVDFVYSLGIYGLCLRELIRTVDPPAFLGNRSSRWFVVGHPDSVYGVILGKLTRSRWHTFHG
jgi:hypothetical protein